MTQRILSYSQRVAVARLHALLELLPRTLDQHMAESGLTWFEFTVLEALAEADNRRLRLSALAARTNATLPRLSRVVTGLENRGLLVRAACTQDGRATNAVLTDAGERAYAEARPDYERMILGLVLGQLDEADTDALSRVTRAILAQLDPEGHLSATADDAACSADPAAVSAAESGCAADPTPSDACAADPVGAGHSVGR